MSEHEHDRGGKGKNGSLKKERTPGKEGRVRWAGLSLMGKGYWTQQEENKRSAVRKVHHENGTP